LAKSAKEAGICIVAIDATISYHAETIETRVDEEDENLSFLFSF
jgi:hypothetical protein